MIYFKYHIRPGNNKDPITESARYFKNFSLCRALPLNEDGRNPYRTPYKSNGSGPITI